MLPNGFIVYEVSAFKRNPAAHKIWESGTSEFLAVLLKQLSDYQNDVLEHIFADVMQLKIIWLANTGTLTETLI